jgi:hypothetical protein
VYRLATDPPVQQPGNNGRSAIPNALAVDRMATGGTLPDNEEFSQLDDLLAVDAIGPAIQADNAPSPATKRLESGTESTLVDSLFADWGDKWDDLAAESFPTRQLGHGTRSRLFTIATGNFAAVDTAVLRRTQDIRSELSKLQF